MVFYLLLSSALVIEKVIFNADESAVVELPQQVQPPTFTDGEIPNNYIQFTTIIIA